jgi:uncharacterized membrane protein YfcA
MLNDLRFRKAVFYLPLAAACGSFVLNWLFLAHSLSESFFTSAFVFLLICFIGLVYEAVKRRNLR